MFVNRITVNGVVLVTAFVRALESGLSITGITEAGENFKADVEFANGMNMNFGVEVAEVAPAKKERKARKPKAAPEVAEVAAPVVESAEVPSDEEYLSLTSSRGRGRPSKAVAAKIAAYKAAHNIE